MTTDTDATDKDSLTVERSGRRPPSEAAKWHMSRQAVDLSVPEVQRWTEAQCHEFLVEVRFGNRSNVSCLARAAGPPLSPRTGLPVPAARQAPARQTRPCPA